MTIPERRLSKRVIHGLEVLHNVVPVLSARLDVLKQTDEDILMDVGVPPHSLTSSHGVFGEGSDNIVGDAMTREWGG